MKSKSISRRALAGIAALALVLPFVLQSPDASARQVTVKKTIVKKVAAKKTIARKPVSAASPAASVNDEFCPPPHRLVKFPDGTGCWPIIGTFSSPLPAYDASGFKINDQFQLPAGSTVRVVLSGPPTAGVPLHLTVTKLQDDRPSFTRSPSDVVVLDQEAVEGIVDVNIKITDNGNKYLFERTMPGGPLPAGTVVTISVDRLKEQ